MKAEEELIALKARIKGKTTVQAIMVGGMAVVAVLTMVYGFSRDIENQALADIAKIESMMLKKQLEGCESEKK